MGQAVDLQMDYAVIKAKKPGDQIGINHSTPFLSRFPSAVN
jgi:hypothetical protein